MKILFKDLETSKEFLKFNGLIFLSIVFLILLCLIARSPLFLLLILVLFNTLPFLNMIPRSWNISKTSQKALEAIIYFFWVIGFIDFLNKIYYILYFFLSYRQFKFVIVLLYSGCFLYFISIRYLVFMRMEGIYVPWWAYGIYFISIMFWILRSVISLSIFLIPYVLQQLPDYTISKIDPIIPETAEDVSLNKATHGSRRSFFFGKHHHIHNYPNSPIPRSYFYRNCGLVMGGVGLCLSSFACYQYHISAQATVKATEATIRAAEATIRAADAAEVQAGLMSKEEFRHKHK